jgi:hypothetical protein
MRWRATLLLALMSVAFVVVGGVALAATAITGTAGNDTLKGTNGTDAIIGKAGNDDLFGLKGTDAMNGGRGRDAVLGGNEFGPKSGDRALAGGRGSDFVGGGRGSDGLTGGAGRDYMYAGPSRGEKTDDVDSILAGADNDAVEAANRPAARDAIDCGGGFDRVLADRKDVLAGNCEKKFTSPRKFFTSISPNYFDPLP